MKVLKIILGICVFILHFNTIFAKTHKRLNTKGDLGSTRSPYDWSIKNIDLDGDGNYDNIFYKENEMQNHFIEINNSFFNEGSTPFTSDLNIVDIDSKDKYKEIAVGDEGPSDDYTTRFYYYNGKNIIKMGETGGMIKYGIKIDGSGILYASQRGKILQTWFYIKKYRINSAHLLEAIPQDLYKMDTDVTLKDFLPLSKSRTDNTMITTLGPGESARILASDDEKWCLVESSGGIQGWFAIDGFSFIHGIGKSAYDIFEGLCSAD